MSDATIRLVVFDWAGTIVDHGSIAPISALSEAFAELGLKLDEREARAPMGLNKRDHIAELMRSPQILAQWEESFGRLPASADGDALYERFLPLQMRAAERRATLLPGVLDCCAALRKKGIAIGTTTGYPRQIGQAVARAAREEGFAPDSCVFPDDVPAGRPEPWMIFRNMEATRTAPPHLVVKVGDTVPDIEEGRNAGAWSVGVTETGSEIALSLDEWRAIPAPERARRAQRAGEKLLRAGAHAVVSSVADVPAFVDVLNGRLERRERP